MAVSTTRRYAAFGLTVDSDVDLPELESTSVSHDGEADVRIVTDSISTPPDAPTDHSIHVASGADHYLVYDYATVRIQDGRRITIDPRADAPHEIVRHVLLGPALNHLLHQREYYVLHASTVAFDDLAVAFVGPSGQGKTTTAMACLAAGHRVLSDDVAAIRLTDDGPVVQGGYGAIKLHPEAAGHFDAPVGEPTRTCSKRDRHFHSLPHDVVTDPIPLAGVYLLEDGPTLELSRLSPSEQVMTLVDNTYTIGTLNSGDTATVNFETCAAVADQTAVKRLRRPREFDALPKVADAVCADIGMDH